MAIVSDGSSLLKRHPENPIIKPEDFPGAYAIFNPGQTLFNGKPLLLLPIRHNSGQYQGRHVDGTVHVATSEDYVHFDINPTPLFERSTIPPYSTVHEQGIDFRVTNIEGDYYIVHPGCGRWGTLGILARTKDFQSMENIDLISLPDNRLPSLFPERINGCYARLDRPYRVCPNDMHEMGNLWISYSPDLIHWGRHRPLLTPHSHWCSTKIGPTPPIKTPQGWLVVIHGVTRNAAGSRYSIGAILLDADDPEQIVGKTTSALLSPREPYEFHGIVPNTVFPAGAIGNMETDELHVYYGCADTCVGLATGCISEVVDACIRNP